MLYGERDYWPDGSFVTTEWFVVAWVPLIPICSKRVSYNPDNPYACFDAGAGVYVYETLGVDRRQAAYTYLWIMCAIAPLVIWAEYQDALSKFVGDENWAAGLFLILTGGMVGFPHLLRRYIKRRNHRKWKRLALGMHDGSRI